MQFMYHFIFLEKNGMHCSYWRLSGLDLQQPDLDYTFTNCVALLAVHLNVFTWRQNWHMKLYHHRVHWIGDLCYTLSNYSKTTLLKDASTKCWNRLNSVGWIVFYSIKWRNVSPLLFSLECCLHCWTKQLVMSSLNPPAVYYWNSSKPNSSSCINDQTSSSSSSCAEKRRLNMNLNEP